jgi:tRNA(fMet)-specific endonuclease VapC
MRELDDAIGRFLVFPYDVQLAVLWGKLKAQAVRDGLALGATPQNNDMWVCALAILRGLPLMTKNLKHFGGFPGLNLVTLGAYKPR